MLTIVVAAVGGAIGALATLALNTSPTGAVIAAGAGFLLVLVLMWIWSRRSVTTVPQILVSRFRHHGARPDQSTLNRT